MKGKHTQTKEVFSPTAAPWSRPADNRKRARRGGLCQENNQTTKAEQLPPAQHAERRAAAEGFYREHAEGKKRAPRKSGRSWREVDGRSCLNPPRLRARYRQPPRFPVTLPARGLERSSASQQTAGLHTRAARELQRHSAEARLFC